MLKMLRLLNSGRTGRAERAFVPPMAPKRETAEDLARRSPMEVFHDHFQLRVEGRLEEDLARNYHPNVVFVSDKGNFYGHDGVRQSAAILRELVPTTDYTLFKTHVDEDGHVYEWWGAKTPEVAVHDGYDGFIIQDGKIVLQSAYYTVVPNTQRRGECS